MNKQQQKGSAHIVIIVLLIIAVFGLLGFVFWQNSISKHDTKTTTSTIKVNPKPAVSNKPALLKASFNSAFKDTVSFQYPSTWKLSTTLTGPIPIDETGQNPTNETFKVTSPSGGFSVTYIMGSTGGVGGTCDPTQTLDKIAQSNYVELSNFDGANYTQAVIENDTDSTYFYDTRLSKTIALQDLNIGQGVCLNTLPLGGFFSLPQGRMLRANIDITKLDNSDGTAASVTSISDITKAFAQLEYIQAKNILLSTSAPADQS